MAVITDGNLQSDLRMASRLGLQVLTILQDTADIIDTGALFPVGTVNGFGSATISVPFAGLHNDRMAATAAEDTAIGGTALADSSVDLSVVRHAIAREITDLAQITATGAGDIQLQKLAESLVTSARLGVMDDIAAAIDSFTSSVGTSASDMTVDDFFDAVFTLELANCPGPFYCLLSPRQLADFQESLRAEGGALQYQAATADLLNAKPQGFQGRFANVDIYRSAYVDNDGTDDKGGMWSTGAIGWATGQVPPPRAGGTIFQEVLPWLALEFDRDPSKAVSSVIAHAYYGVGVIEQARGVEIKTDTA